jgi:hypothetical protein
MASEGQNMPQTRIRRRSLPAVLVLAVVLNATAANAQPAAVTFDPPAVSLICGETVTIEVHVDASVTDLRGFSLVLAFDGSVINPVAVQAGSLLVDAACPYFLDWLNPAESDSVSVDGATLGCSVSGPGAILTIEFEGIEDGSTTLGCQEGRLRTGDNAPIEFDCGEAEIDVSCPVPSRQESWGTVKTWYH